MFIVLSWVLLFIPLVNAFSFSAQAPTECDPLAVSWTGGTAPFFLNLIPAFGIPQNISIPVTAFNNGQGSFSLTQLPLPQGQKFVIAMSDSAGFGTGGATDLLTVGTSKGGKCNIPKPSLDFSFQLNSALAQCRPFVFDGYDTAVQPVTIMGIIPSGTPFVLHPPVAPQFTWTANVEHGTSIIFIMVDALGRQGGSSDIMIVASSDDQTCLNGLSPSSTSALPATTQTSTPSSTTKATTPTTSAAPAASSSQPASSGGTSIGAIAGTVIGALLFLAAVITLALFFIKRRKDSPAGPSTSTGFPPYNGSHNYSLSSSANPAYTSTPGPYTPQQPYGSQSLYDSQPSYGSQPYGRNYQPSAYAASTYTPSTQQTHNHTLSGGPAQAYDGYQGSMLPYDSNPFLDDPPQQQYPPSHYQSTYQLPSASAYALPNITDPFNSPLTGQGYPPPPPPHAIEDPFASSEQLSTVESMTSSQQRKAAMAGLSPYKGPSRIVVHTDADDVLPPPNADGVVELPPQYTERRGLAVVNESPPSPSHQTQFPPSTQHQLPPPPPPGSSQP